MEKKQPEGRKHKGMQNIPGGEESTSKLTGLTGVDATTRTDTMMQVSSRKGSKQVSQNPQRLPNHLPTQGVVSA